MIEIGAFVSLNKKIKTLMMCFHGEIVDTIFYKWFFLHFLKKRNNNVR